MFALVLEANPTLTWRDLQHLVVNTSKKNDPGDSEWIINGAGHHVNNKYGFGVLDAAALVDLASHPKWKTANEQHVCRELGGIGDKAIPGQGTLTLTLTSKGCLGKSNHIMRLEHVRVYITISHPRRGALGITLVSPSGTASDLLRKRDRDISSDGFQNWPFMSVFFWGENPRGNWTLKITNHEEYEGTFKTWSMILYGTVDANHKITAAEKEVCFKNCKKSCPVSFGEVCHNCSLYCDCETGECLRYCHEEDEVDEKRRHCLSPTYKNINLPDSDSDEVSTFVKWLIIFSLLGVLMVTVLIIYFLKVSGRLCWRTRPLTDNTNAVEKNAGHSANDSSKTTHEGSTGGTEVTSVSEHRNGTVNCSV